MRTSRALLIGLAAGVLLPACAHPNRAAETISYETSPCFGACPVFKVTVKSDGTGVFEGRRFTAVEGIRRFRVTPGQYRAFAARLAPVRPASGTVSYSGENCENIATDLPSVDVTWTSARREVRHLSFYHGCDMEKNRPIAERLQSAATLLPIAEWIKPPPGPLRR